MNPVGVEREATEARSKGGQHDPPACPRHCAPGPHTTHGGARHRCRGAATIRTAKTLGRHVRARQIYDVNIVTRASAIYGVIITTKNL